MLRRWCLSAVAWTQCHVDETYWSHQEVPYLRSRSCVLVGQGTAAIAALCEASTLKRRLLADNQPIMREAASPA
jgi:hypothetical protein